MAVALGRAFVEQEHAGGGVLGDELYGAVHDGILHEALARQRRIVARREARAPARLERDDLRGARSFRLRHAEE